MKNLPRLFVLCLLVIVALSAMSSVAFAAPKLVFSDEFNGPLDGSAWQTTNPWYLCQAPQELEYYDPACTTFGSGSMNLTAEKRSMNGHSYTSGIVSSVNRPQFSYGYFEMRGKLPTGPGIWPAFWLVGNGLEIDGLEMLGDRPSRIYMTLHVGDSQIYQGIKDGPNYSAGFHTYGIDWQPTYVKWYIDGVQVAAYNHAVPSTPQTICINNAVGGAWPGSPTSATKFPTTFSVDYIRVYDTKPAADVVPGANNDSYSVDASSALSVPSPGVLANDVAAQGKTLTGLLMSRPAHGQLSLASNGSFTYEPDAGFLGKDSFTYADVDGSTTGDSATVSLSVLDPNAPTPTTVTRPAVKRRSASQRRYSIVGGLHLGSSPALVQAAASTPAKPVMLTLQIRRYVHGTWHTYRTVRWTNPPAHYTSNLSLAAGTYRVRSLVSGGTAPAGQSIWTKSFRVR